mgnify:CR=1 FL=1
MKFRLMKKYVYFLLIIIMTAAFYGNAQLPNLKKKLEKNLTSQILQDINIFLGIIGNDI